MVQSYSKEEHDKCKAVAETFRELYGYCSMDTDLLGAGKICSKRYI